LAEWRPLGPQQRQQLALALAPAALTLARRQALQQSPGAAMLPRRLPPARRLR
jgi:hypothetical protein